MRRWLFACALALGLAAGEVASAQPTAAVPIPADIDPATMAAAQRYMTAAHMDEQIMRVMDQIIPAILGPLGQAHGLSADQAATLQRIILEEVHRDPSSILQMVAIVHARHLSRADLNAAAEFYESEAGQHFLAAQTSPMATELQAVGEHWATDILMPRVLERIEEINRAPPART